MKSRKEKAIEHLTEKEVIENIFKSIGWVMLTGAIFGFSMFALQIGAYKNGFAIFVVFVLLSLLSIYYVLAHVLRPMEEAIEKKENTFKYRTRSFNSTTRLVEVSKLYFASSSFIYPLIFVSYFFFAHMVADIIVDTKLVVNKQNIARQ